MGKEYHDETVEIGEIPVEIKYAYCCGQIEYYGKFPDGTFCCSFAEHGSNEEALGCSKSRVAKGFTFKKPNEEAM
jgi:hypothetical protein